MYINITGGERLKNFKVVLSNYDWSTSPGFLLPHEYETCLHYEDQSSNGAVITADCSHLKVSKTRYVYIVKEDTDSDALNICEVQVFAECK